MRLYCMKTCISIYHGSSGERRKAHCHTIEVVAYIERPGEDFARFSEVETVLNSYMSQYRNQFLNALPEFHGDTSIEGIGEAFFAGISTSLQRENLVLKRLEVSETPLRRYVIGVEEPVA